VTLGLGRLQVSRARGYDEELLPSTSSCLLASSVGSDDMMMGSPSPIPCGRRRGRGAEDVRSQSRSPSPSVAPRMPKDNDEAVMHFSTWRQVDEGDVQIVLEDDEDGDVGVHAGEGVDTREGQGKKI
jgi:hypothetical protein